MSAANKGKEELGVFLLHLSKFGATPIETSFRSHDYVNFAKDHWEIPIVCVVGYLLFCFFGQKIMAMEKVKAFDLQLSLAGWNALLCLFSFVGMFRTVPFLISLVLTKRYEETICTAPNSTWGNGAVGFWVTLFIFSKIPELIDSVFIVLRKRPLIFLHWYHHVTVLLFCWSSYSTMAASGLYFVAMNYTVHALMYGYYCLQALNMCPKSFPAVLITISQVTQMLVGTIVCASAWFFSFHGQGDYCHNELSNLLAGGVMYGSYLYLFVDFAFRRLGPGGGHAKKRGSRSNQFPKKIE